MNRTICQEKKEFFDAYRNATRAHSESIAHLQKKMGTSSKADYDAMYQRAEALRIKAAEAKDALDNHVAGHEC
jgi:hypothetical protein